MATNRALPSFHDKGKEKFAAEVTKTVASRREDAGHTKQNRRQCTDRRDTKTIDNIRSLEIIPEQKHGSPHIFPVCSHKMPQPRIAVKNKLRTETINQPPAAAPLHPAPSTKAGP